MNQDPPQPTTHRSPLITHQSLRLWAGLLFVAIALVSLALGWFGVDWDEVLAAVQERRQAWQVWIDVHLWLAAGLYFVTYVTWTGLSLPGAPILTLAGGAFFGLRQGVI